MSDDSDHDNACDATVELGSPEFRARLAAAKTVKPAAAPVKGRGRPSKRDHWDLDRLRDADFRERMLSGWILAALDGDRDFEGWLAWFQRDREDAWRKAEALRLLRGSNVDDEARPMPDLTPYRLALLVVSEQFQHFGLTPDSAEKLLTTARRQARHRP